MGNEQWHPDIIITDDFVRHLIEKQFSELAPVKLQCIGEGWDNKVFLVNEDVIFRFPHRAISSSLIERENNVLKHLQSRVNLAIPHPIYIGKPDEAYPYDFHGYPMIGGQSVCDAALTAQARERSITKLAEFLRKLHNINEGEARKMGAENQVFDRTLVDRLISALMERVDKINNRNIAVINREIFEEEIQIAKEITLPEKKSISSRRFIFSSSHV